MTTFQVPIIHEQKVSLNADSPSPENTLSGVSPKESFGPVAAPPLYCDRLSRQTSRDSVEKSCHKDTKAQSIKACIVQTIDGAKAPHAPYDTESMHASLPSQYHSIVFHILMKWHDTVQRRIPFRLTKGDNS